MGTDNFKRLSFWEGETIFTEGDRGRAAFLVISGAVEISTNSDGCKVVLGEIHENGLFGEMALIDDSPRMATATAIAQTICLIIPDYLFVEKLASVDPFTRALLRMLCGNVRSISKRFANYFHIDPNAKLKARIKNGCEKTLFLDELVNEGERHIKKEMGAGERLTSLLNGAWKQLVS